MEQKTMLVRTGGDVVRRPVAHEAVYTDSAGRQRLISQEPELREGELLVRTLSDRLPTIVKT